MHAMAALQFATTHCAVQCGNMWPPGGLKEGNFFFYGQTVGGVTAHDGLSGWAF